MGIINRNELEALAAALISPGKGILAADESPLMLEQRLSGLGVEPTEDSRRAYREMLFTTPNLHRFISGVIMHDETIRQKLSDETPFAERLQRDGIVPGVRADRGTSPLAGSQHERIVEGSDGLRDRLAEYKSLGARFAKWRAVFSISGNTPTATCIDANAQALGGFSALCQEMKLLPVIEVEVLMSGNHSLEHSWEVTGNALRRVFFALFDYGVRLEEMLLRPNMVIPGLECPEQKSPGEVARTTMSCMRRVVPVAVPGILFLSGGQSPDVATARLNAINTMGKHPWELSFSFGRALQAPALHAWQGDPAKLSEGQQALYERAKCNCAARYGKYSPDMEPKS